MLFFKITKTITEDILQLLKKNIIGTPKTGMRYQHYEVSKKIAHIKNPYYVNLFHHQKLIGTCTFCSRTTFNVSKSFHSYYIRYFTFSDKFRTTHSTIKSSKTRKTIIRNEVNQVLEGLEFDSSKPVFFHYAYVDPRNTRSAKLCTEFGFEAVRQFSTIIFHRINPKDIDATTMLINEAEVKDMKSLLYDFYKTYTMFSTENLFDQGNYYVIKDANNTILAGVQANPDHWKILELPGKMGAFTLKAFSILPFLKKVINKDYHFLTIEGVYYKKGNEKQLEILIESLLAIYKLNSAMMWADTYSDLYQKLHSLDLGIVSKINQEVKADIMCKYVGFEHSEIAIFKQNPAYISGIDLT